MRRSAVALTAIDQRTKEKRERLAAQRPNSSSSSSAPFPLAPLIKNSPLPSPSLSLKITTMSSGSSPTDLALALSERRTGERGRFPGAWTGRPRFFAGVSTTTAGEERRLRLPVAAPAPLRGGTTREELRSGSGCSEGMALRAREEGVRLSSRESSSGSGVAGSDCASSSPSGGRSI
jgi:hypothetical protein